MLAPIFSNRSSHALSVFCVLRIAVCVKMCVQLLAKCSSKAKRSTAGQSEFFLQPCWPSSYMREYSYVTQMFSPYLQTLHERHCMPNSTTLTAIKLLECICTLHSLWFHSVARVHIKQTRCFTMFSLKPTYYRVPQSCFSFVGLVLIRWLLPEHFKSVF